MYRDEAVPPKSTPIVPMKAINFLPVTVQLKTMQRAMDGDWEVNCQRDRQKSHLHSLILNRTPSWSKLAPLDWGPE